MAAERRTHSIFEAAGLIGVHRNTLMKWINDGCPAVSRGDSKRGKEWEISLPDVWAWREQRLVEEIASQFRDKTGATNEAGYRTRKAAADAIVAEIEAQEALRSVVDVEYVTQKLSSFLADLRGKLSSLGAKVAGRAASMTSPAAIKELVDQEVRESLRAVNGVERIGTSGDPRA
jgi:phage terminase Nu1 subunit (DNA packaging protein)